MAKEDFCFTYYDGDAARDKAHMNRLERGAYDDIISAQRKRGHLLLEDIKRVLSKDFETCWASLEWILKKDQDGKYYIEWVDKSIDKMRRHSERQKENGRLGGRPKNPNETQTKPTGLKTETQLKPKPLKKETQTQHKKKPLEDGDGNEDGNELGFGDENFGKSENLFELDTVLAKMMTVWKEKNVNYPEQQEDIPALGAISRFICAQEGVSYQPGEADTVIKILNSWRIMTDWIVSHNLYSGFNIQQIFKYRQNIVTDIKNGKQPDKNGQPKSGQKITAERLHEANSKFYRKGGSP